MAVARSLRRDMVRVHPPQFIPTLPDLIAEAAGGRRVSVNVEPQSCLPGPARAGQELVQMGGV